jgi:hydroxymethylbilane synthase
MTTAFSAPSGTIRIGTRKSRLALVQAELLRAALTASFPHLSFDLVPMITTGDRNTKGSLADIGGKGLFTKELEEGLLEGNIHLAVHSLKDMETHLPPGLMIGAVLPREDPRDALVAKDGHTLASLPEGARVGTSSMRRAAQLIIARDDLAIVPFRGNVNTRLAKLKAGEVDATLLALAGLKRIGMQAEATEILDTSRFIPAAGQGTIAVECREDSSLRDMLRAISHGPTNHAMLAERAVLAAIDGSCRTPIGAYAHIQDGRLRLNTMVAKPDGTAHAQTSREGSVEDAEAMGRDAGLELLAHGGKDWFR